jgi:hypothetical protein
MTQLISVPIASIDANPFRSLEKYPYIDRKLDAIQRSINDVGLWEGIIARKKGNRHELAFGHHRFEAARRFGLKIVPLIIRDLTDEQMLQFMGRENTEDYNADFLCMLETWEAAVGFFEKNARRAAHKLQPLDIARVLGWTRSDHGGCTNRLNDTACACSAAHSLISGGYLSRADLHNLSVAAAREILERAQTRIEQLEKAAKAKYKMVPRSGLVAAQKQVGKAAQITAQQARRGEIAHKDLRSQVDTNAYQFAGQKVKESPLFNIFVNAAIASIEKMLKGDAAEEKLREIIKVKDAAIVYEDLSALKKLAFVLGDLSERASTWRVRVTEREAKIVNIGERRIGGGQ